MDYIYEQEASEKLSDSQETLKAQESADTNNADINRRTEESFQKLEDEITKTYTAFESTASTWGTSFSSFITNLKVNDVLEDARKQMENLHIENKLQGIQKRLVGEENAAKSKDMLALLSQKTNSYLDDLDKDLEQVENTAGAYVSKFGQFLKETIAVSAPEDMDELIDDQDGELLFNVGSSGQNLAASRTDAQLFTLNTSTELYLTNDQDPKFDEFRKTFNVESKTTDITQLLKQSSNLQKLSTEIVPAKVKYEEFWARYFYMHEKILQQESHRKKLLSEKRKAETKEDLDWGDDDEESSGVGSKKNDKSSASSEGTYELNSVDSSTVEVNKKKSDKGAPQNGDEDDDWE